MTVASWVTPVVVIGLVALLVSVGVVFWKGARWTGSVDSELGALKDFMKEIRIDIKKIFGQLPGPRVAESQSPARLTPFGRGASAGHQAGSGSAHR